MSGGKRRSTAADTTLSSISNGRGSEAAQAPGSSGHDGDALDAGTGRGVGAEPACELVQRGGRARGLDLHAPGGVADAAGEPKLGGQTPHERPEADALNHALDVEGAGGMVRIGGRDAHVRGDGCSHGASVAAQRRRAMCRTARNRVRTAERRPSLSGRLALGAPQRLRVPVAQRCRRPKTPRRRRVAVARATAYRGAMSSQLGAAPMSSRRLVVAAVAGVLALVGMLPASVLALDGPDVSGTVTLGGAPVEGASVQVAVAGSDMVFTATTDAKGAWGVGAGIAAGSVLTITATRA